MSEIQHQDLAAGRWWELSLFEQLGNIGSEVSRAARWQSRKPETARAREIVADFFEGANQYRSTASSLQRYFDAYAVAANRSRTRAESA